MTRIWFLDGTYMDVKNDQVQYWAMDWDVERIQPYDKDGKLLDEDN